MISICMIVKNEEKVLDQCLKHLIPYGYEIVIADTGSVDSTKEIALKYTDKVFDYVWTDNFAAARNYAISQATNDMILCIDSDEIVTYLDKNSLEHLITENSYAIGRLIIVNEFNRNQESYRSKERISRLFSRSYYQYTGAIHEQIIRKDHQPGTYYDIPIEMIHKGYEGDLSTRLEKTKRNISLLERQLDMVGEDPYLLYQLGKSYYMQEDYRTACDRFGKALYFDLDPQLDYVQDMVESYGYTLLNTNQFVAALDLLNVYDEFAVNADFVFLAGLIYMNNGKFKEAIHEFLKATTMKNCKVDGVNSYRAFYNTGVIYECLGDTMKAKEYYHECGTYKPAENRLNSL